MKQNIKDINRYNSQKKYFLKKEIKLKILKSIIQNKNFKPIIRIFSSYKILKLIKHKKINKLKNICLSSGKKKSLFNFCKMSRHVIHNLNKFTKLTNIKIKS
jgi:ribosomal protein S14